MSFFLCCLSGKRKKSIDNYSNSNEQLPRVTKMIRESGHDSKIHTSKTTNLKEVKRSKSSLKHSFVRNQGYSQVTNLTAGLNMYLTDEELNFKMDYNDGISHNLAINTFHYEVKNEQPGFMYYQNIGPNGLQQKQQTKKLKSKQKDHLHVKDKADEMPTRY